MNIKPRDYQQRIVDECISSNVKHNIIAAGMRQGKSVIAQMLVDHYLNEGEQVVVITNISGLIEQLDKHIPNCNIIANGKERTTDSDVYLCMEQTLINRKENFNLKDCILIKDEAIGINAKRVNDIIEHLSPKKRFTLSGTPYDNKGITIDIGARIIKGLTTEEAMNKKILCPVKYYVTKIAKKLDFQDLKSSGGDYSNESIDQVITSEWLECEWLDWFKSLEHNDKYQLIVTSNIEKADFITELLLKNNFNAISFHSKSEPHIQKYGLEWFRKDDNKVLHYEGYDVLVEDTENKNIKEIQKTKTKIMVSVSKVSIGADFPKANRLIWIRPTKSLPMFKQGFFRVRNYQEDKIAEVYDMGNCLASMGFPDTEFYGYADSQDYKKNKDKNKIPEINNLESEEISWHEIEKYRNSITNIRNVELSKLSKEDLKKLFEATNDIEEFFKITYYIWLAKEPTLRKSTTKWCMDYVVPIYNEYERASQLKLLLYYKKRFKTMFIDTEKKKPKYAGLRYYIDWLVNDSYMKNGFIKKEKEYEFDEDEINF